MTFQPQAADPNGKVWRLYRSCHLQCNADSSPPLNMLNVYTVAGSMRKSAGRPSPDPDYVLRGHQAEVQALLFHPTQDILLSG